MEIDTGNCSEDRTKYFEGMLHYQKGDSFMKTTMVIPSYWAREKAEGEKPGDAVYDHQPLLTKKGPSEGRSKALTSSRKRTLSL